MKPEFNLIDDYECGVNEKTRHELENGDSQEHTLIEHLPVIFFFKKTFRKEL